MFYSHTIHTISLLKMQAYPHRSLKNTAAAAAEQMGLSWCTRRGGEVS